MIFMISLGQTLTISWLWVTQHSMHSPGVCVYKHLTEYFMRLESEEIMYSFLKICFVLEVELMKLKLKIKDFTLKCSINLKKKFHKNKWCFQCTQFQKCTSDCYTDSGIKWVAVKTVTFQLNGGEDIVKIHCYPFPHLILNII